MPFLVRPRRNCLTTLKQGMEPLHWYTRFLHASIVLLPRLQTTDLRSLEFQVVYRAHFHFLCLPGREGEQQAREPGGCPGSFCGSCNPGCPAGSGGPPRGRHQQGGRVQAVHRKYLPIPAIHPVVCASTMASTCKHAHGQRWLPGIWLIASCRSTIH